jgi:BolA family transcriptional regulator, general stress-responsive regulator
MDPRAERVERLLRERLRPVHLELHDDTEAHKGHAGAKAGGAHLRVVVASAAFEGLSRVEQHKLVQDLVKDLIREGAIHALQLRTSPASTWKAP